jgi:hypothetical protein
MLRKENARGSRDSFLRSPSFIAMERHLASMPMSPDVHQALSLAEREAASSHAAVTSKALTLFEKHAAWRDR